jgi:hypothetical protein
MSGGPATIFTRIRESCAAVCAEAQHVRIVEDHVVSYAQSLPLERLGLDGLDAGTHLLGQGEQTLVFMLALDSINFGSGYFTHLEKLPGMSGYFTVASGLKEWFEVNGPISATDLSSLSAEDCVGIFHQDPRNAPVVELMSMFASALRLTGNLVTTQFGGSFPALIEAAEGRASGLMEILCQIPYFVDEQEYKGRKVAFYKRAQITCADLALAFEGQPWGTFSDIDELTSFADNLVPHVLWVDGLLTYDPALVERIDDGELLAPGSEEEIELRAAAVHGVELIRQALAEEGIAVPSMRLDFLLWNRGQGPQYKSLPRHRTRTVFY